MRGPPESAPRVDVTIAVPCRSDEPGLARTLDALTAAAAGLETRGHRVTFAICVNGPDGPARAVAEDFVAGVGPDRACLLPLGKADKAAAWNRLRGASESEWIVFCDADVEPDPDALVRLAESLEARPHAAVATARLEPDLRAATVVARAAALPHRFDFGVVRGPLYLLRARALLEMPEGLLLEDAWLSAELGGRGAGAVLSVWSAVVRYRPAASLREYYRERLRTEAGKIQIRADRALRKKAQTPIAHYPWQHFLAELGPRDWPLVALNLGVRMVARVVAEIAFRRGHEIVWRTVETSKASVPRGRWSRSGRAAGRGGPPSSGPARTLPASGPAAQGTKGSGLE